MKEILITLRESQLRHAVAIGIERQIDNYYRKRRPAYGATHQNEWQMHIIGALGEKAVSVCFGIPWTGALGDLSAKDVGQLQVRSTTYSTGKLTVHKKDSGRDVFILVTGRGVHQTLRGYQWGIDAKRAEYWSELIKGSGRWAYNVPQDDLRPISDLKESFEL